MKEAVVGIYRFGNEQCKLVLREGKGADFSFRSSIKGEIPLVQVGGDVEEWGEIVSGLLHEVLEYTMTRNNLRFNPCQDFSNDLSSYVFFMTHSMMSDCCAKSAMLLTFALPDLEKAWNRWQKKVRKKQ
jgi:hypothetical protein